MSTAAPTKRGRRVLPHPRPRSISAAHVPTSSDPAAPTAAAASLPRLLRRGHTMLPRAGPAPAAAPPADNSAYEARERASRGAVERSVAAAVVSATRQRGLSRKPRPQPLPAAPELPPHHRRHGGFCNPWESAVKENGMRVRGGAGSRTFFHKVAKDRRPPDEQLASMLLLADRPRFHEAAETLESDKYALVSFWIGHCTFLIRAKGLTVLTDPVWSLRLGPLGPRRLIPPPCDISELPEIVDVVILSSACYDHYDKIAVAALSSRVGKWLVPLGLKPMLLAAGVPEHKVVQLDWWQEHRVKDSLFVCTPAQHCSVREDALWCSWLVHAPHHRFFFCGATGYRAINRDVEDYELFEHRSKYGGKPCPVFKEISRRYGSCDTAFLPIGGFKPRAVVSGVQGDAVDMLFVHQDLRARRSVVHRWGTFACNDEGMLDAVRTLEAGLLSSPIAEHEVTYVRHGRLHVT